MTILVMGVSLLLSGLLAAGTMSVGRAAVERSRAQLAADAAALAAVAESALAGSGAPARTASHYARLNGGRLVRCLCYPGATAAQVEVAVGEATARARAVFDPERVMQGSTWSSGLDPRLALAVRRLIDAGEGRITVVSGARSFDQQSLLWERALDRYGTREAADDWVAPPGSSAHERGLAVDLGGDVALAARLAQSLGLPLVRPLPHEPWHFELAG